MANASISLLHDLRNIMLFALWLIFHAQIGRAQIAAWQGLRASLFRDSIYTEGGRITNGTWDGEVWQDTRLSGNNHSNFYSIDLTKPFNATDAFSSFKLIQYNYDDTIPTYSYGAMFASKDGLVLYG